MYFVCACRILKAAADALVHVAEVAVHSVDAAVVLAETEDVAVRTGEAGVTLAEEAAMILIPADVVREGALRVVGHDHMTATCVTSGKG